MNFRLFSTNLLLILFCFNSMGLAQAGSAGVSGAAFLKLGVGARAASMGEAYTALTNDVTAGFWNPAGLSLLTHTQVAFTHSEWLQDISHEFIGVAFPALHGTFGVSILASNIAGIEHRTTASTEPIGIVEANDVAASLSYGRSVGNRLNAGITLKYIYEKIFIESASGYAFDFGLIYQPFEIPLKLGFVVQNFGSMNNLLNESIELPRTTKLGVAYQIDLSGIDSGFVLAADAVKLTETDLRANLGLEFQLKNYFAFRFGYQSGFDARAISGGFGLFLKRYHFDYGYVPFNSDLGNTHKFSFVLDLKK